MKVSQGCSIFCSPGHVAGASSEAESTCNLMKKLLRLAGLTVAVCFFAKADPVGDPANKDTAPADAAAGDKAKEQLHKIFAAFAANDETTGRKIAQEFLSMQGLVAPQQLQAVQLLLRISNPPTLKDESPDEAKIRAEAIKVSADLNTTQAQLNKIEAIAATMPKSGFTQGGQTHQRWIQLGNERGRLWGERDKLVKRQGELSIEYAKAHSTRLVSVETELLDVASRFAEQGDIEGALAFCNTYLRKNPSAQNVAKKGQEFFERKNMPPHAQALAERTSATPQQARETARTPATPTERVGQAPMTPIASSSAAPPTTNANNTGKPMLDDEPPALPPEIHQGLEAARKSILGVWTYTGRDLDLGGDTKWLKYVFNADGSFEIFIATATDDNWGKGTIRERKWKPITGKYSETGQRYYAIEYGDAKPGILLKNGKLLVTPFTFDVRVEFTKGDKVPFSK